ncbi:MAG TPA: hypothetical protein VEA78_08100, partial [Acidimicrobiales bacterium]|nr:hypothetical protein [Acidimicrobiales bacterium]
MLAGSVGMVRRAAPRRFVAAVVIQLTGAVAVALQLLVVRGLLAELLDADATFREVAPELVALVVLSGISSATSLLANANYQVLTQLVGLHTAEAVIATATRVDLVAYESPTFHDRLQRAQVSAGTRPTQLTNGVIGLLGSALSIVGVGVALLVIQPLFCALVLVAYVPAWLASHRAGALSYRFSLTQTERERRRWYLFGVLTKKQEAQEVRAFDLVDVLTRRHRELFTEQIADLGDMVGRRLRLSLAGQAATALLSGAAVALLVWFVTSGRLSIAGGGTAAGGVLLLTSRLRGLAGSLGGLYEGALFLDDYSSFVDAASKLDAARPERQLPTGFEVLEARSVSFTYPSRTEPALVDASLVLRRGEVVALVGENGSGKTTFA